MFYIYEPGRFPIIRGFYSVTRNTVWQITDNHNILIIVTKGKCRISCNGETSEVCCGDVYFIPAGTEYTRTSVDDSMCTMTYIHFDTDSAFEMQDANDLYNKITSDIATLDRAMLSDNKETEYPSTVYIQNMNTPYNFEKIIEYVKSINLFSTKRPLMCNWQSSIALCNILATLSQCTIDKISTEVKLRDIQRIPPKLKSAISYIAHHYSEPISLDSLAQHCNVSKQQMIRYFKTAMNTTPTSYITQFKVARAKEFLFNNPGLSIKEISSELGFENQHYFARVFAKATGESPSHYRYRTLNYKD